MRIFSSVAMLGSLFVLAIGAGLAQSQETPDDADQEAVMQKWIEFMTPGAEHELLKKRVGKWSVKMEMWISPDAPASLSEGTSEMKLVMEGRIPAGFDQEHVSGKAVRGCRHYRVRQTEEEVRIGVDRQFRDRFHNQHGVV